MLNYTNFWCFRINALSRKVSRMYNTRCLEHGVTAAQSFVIFDIMNNEGSSIKDIASRVELDSPAVTGLVDRLVRENLVERMEDPEDRRSIKMYLTEKGRLLLEEKLEPMALDFNNFIRSMVDPEISSIFQRSLDLIDSQVNKTLSE